MDTAAFIEHLRAQPWYRDQIVHQQSIPARNAIYGDLARPLHPQLQAAFAAQGITQFFDHQAHAINAVREGRNVIVATPAASGKSMCYHVPVLDTMLEDRSAKAMFLFPTKALAQDQQRRLTALVPEGKRIRHDIFDGDTPGQDRTEIRRSAKIVITNPDMLHVGILPNHKAWYDLLRNLRYVVIDEAHVYRGVFGSHVANVIRRLRRLCMRFGSNPQFILCSATIANPGEHAEKLVGLPFTTIDEDGSPYGGKDFLFWNPPMIDLAEGSRRSTHVETAHVMVELLSRRIRTMTFVRSRRMAELMSIFVRDYLREINPGIAALVSPYRAGYLPEDRRRIERDLFEGRLLGLTATTAMELGIDIGNLDATVLSGYPGSVSSTWQQSGRSGRRGQRALSFLMAMDNPLDQYFMRHPEAFFRKPIEAARISPTNPYVLKPQLLCAAYEAPLTEMDNDIFGIDLSGAIEGLVDDGFLQARTGRWHLSPEITYPAQEVGIRSTSGHTYTLVEEDSGVVLETVGESAAFKQLHPGGVYLHQGEAYLITNLDLESRTAYAKQTDVPYYTESRDLTETRILNVYKEKQAGNTKVYLGEVVVSTEVIGFRRKAHFTSEALGDEYVSLPKQSYNTVAFWFDIPKETLDRIHSEKRDLAGGLHASEHAAIGVLPLFALCDRNDIGGISTPLHPDTGRPQVFIHDGHPGGVGIAERGYEVIEDLWRATLEVITNCPCQSGCPSCIHSPKCGNNNHPLDKDVAKMLLTEMLGA